MSGVDIEAIHSEIEEYRDSRRGHVLESYFSSRAYNELVFLFSSVLNEIQNGPMSKPHLRLAEMILPTDAVITFNWDTLLDRALASKGLWRPDWGYVVRPNQLFRDGWKDPQTQVAFNAPKLIKLHGSTNWITAYAIQDATTGELRLTHDLDPASFNVFIEATRPYACYAGRYMAGYEPYSYGYYPPNLNFSGLPAPEGRVIVRVRQKSPWKREGEADSEGLVSMPLIIPPVRNKTYDLFGGLFRTLWNEAEKILAEADEVVVIGYSFPATDIQSDQLFRRAFSRRQTIPRVTVIDPMPLRPASKFRDDFGVREPNLVVRAEYFNENTEI